MVFLYRINGGQVQSSFTRAQDAIYDPTFFALVEDPPAPDGTDLTPPKIYVVASNTMRNATDPEIANFATAQAADATTAQRTSAQNLFTDPVIGKALRGIAGEMVAVANTVRLDPNTTYGALDVNTIVNQILDAIAAGSYE